jgi:geranylgeranyl diphosphate synthase type I
MQLEDVFARFATELDTELAAVIPCEPASLAGMIKYHLGSVDADFRPVTAKTGKRLRPTLCLLCSLAAGGDYQLAVSAAAALELLHNFSLIHDDIQDRSAERRHRPTVWTLWGEAQAINVGDAVFVIAHQAFYRSVARGVPATLVLTGADWFAAAALALCSGQYHDMAFEQRRGVTVDEYMAMARGKTAALLACSAGLGALFGSGDMSKAEPYRRFGEHLGIAFQIQDDIIGIWGDAAVTGKPAADDVRRRKKTLPIVDAMENLGNSARQRLLALFDKPELAESEVGEIIALLDDVGAKERAEAQATAWHGRALKELEKAKPAHGPAAEIRAVSELLLGRRF